MRAILDISVVLATDTVRDYAGRVPDLYPAGHLDDLSSWTANGWVSFVPSANAAVRPLRPTQARSSVRLFSSVQHHAHERRTVEHFV